MVLNLQGRKGQGKLLACNMDDQSMLKAPSILNKHKQGKLHISGTEKNMA